jgi:5-methylcytosine-specific restriction endonuclease McrA
VATQHNSASRICKDCACEFQLTAEFWGRDRSGFRHICKKCDSPRARRWALENPEKDSARKRKWYEQHTAITIARAGRWNAENPEKRRQIASRYTARNRDKQRRNLQAWREKNREKARELVNRWHSEHAAELRAKRQTWRKDHPEEAHRRDQQAWQERYAKHPEASREWQHKRYLLRRGEYIAATANRRARKVPAPGEHTPEDIALLYMAQNGKCAACHVPLAMTGKRTYQVDHIVPLKPRNGGPAGTNDATNLQLLCPPCNSAKSNLSPDEWAARIAKRKKLLPELGNLGGDE